VVDRRIWALIGCTVATYLVLTLAAIFRFEAYFLTEFYGNIFHVMWLNLTGVEVDGFTHLQRGSLYLEGVPTYIYHLTDVLPGGLGWILMIVAGGGMLFSFFRRSPEALVLTGTILIYFLVIGRFWDKPIRYFIPAGPMFGLVAAWALIELGKFFNRILRFSGTAVGLILCGVFLFYGIAFSRIYVADDARVEAAKWVQKHVPTESRLLLERGYNNLSTLISPVRHLQVVDLEQQMYNTPNRRLSVDGDYTACIEGEYLSGGQYLVISDDRMAMAANQPAARRYYNDLFKGKLGYTPVQRFTVQPNLPGLEFDDSWTDLNCRRYDHPATFVFRRTGKASIYETEPHLRAYRLESAEACMEVLNRAVAAGDFTLFRYILPEKLKISLDDVSQMKILEQFIRNPEMLRSANQPGAFIEEDGKWRVNLQVDG